MSKDSTSNVPMILPSYGRDFENIEVRDTIITGIGVPDLFSIDALTPKGDWFRGLILRERDEEYRDDLIRLLKGEHFFRIQKRWAKFKPATLIQISFAEGWQSTRNITSCAGQTLIGAPEQVSEDARSDWMTSSDEILLRLESADTSADDRITAVLFAETTAFDHTEKPRLLVALSEFVHEHRFSKDGELITAAGSAIRKFAMNMPESQFDDYAGFLSRTDTDTLSCDIELELAKAVGWRLSTASSVNRGSYPKLEAALTELAFDYLRPRLVLQKNYASIAIHSIIAVGLLNGDQQDELVDAIPKLRIDWFTEVFEKRLGEFAGKRADFDSANADNLNRLLRRIHAAEK